MTDPQLSPSPAHDLFGTTLAAMVTPMEPGGAISAPGVAALVEHLLATGCDGLVVGGTTGESPTLTDDESARLVADVAARARGRARVVAGVGTYDTAASVRRARAAEAAGADALLVVCPYYSRPSQAGVIAHCTAVADATALPVMLYDVPERTGTTLQVPTLVELADHPRIRAVKDARGYLPDAARVLATTSLACYCGIDELNLPYLACGATGVVSVVANVAAGPVAALRRAVAAGDLVTARAIDAGLAPLAGALTEAGQGAVLAKAALAALGVIPHPAVRLPLVEPPAPLRERLERALAAVAVPA